MARNEDDSMVWENKHIEVQYSCTVCDVIGEEHTVQVPERNPELNAVQWLERVASGCISAHHYNRSPGCTSQQMRYVKIQLPEDAGQDAAYLGMDPHG